MKLMRLFSSAVLVFAVSIPGYAQAVAGMGGLAGVVRDASGAYRVQIPAGQANGTATVWLALYDRAHKTAVQRGENSGSTLTEFNIVREWRKIGDWNGQPIEIALNLTPESDEYDACAVLVQEGGFGAIRGAASFRMEKP